MGPEHQPDILSGMVTSGPNDSCGHGGCAGAGRAESGQPPGDHSCWRTLRAAGVGERAVCADDPSGVLPGAKPPTRLAWKLTWAARVKAGPTWSDAEVERRHWRYCVCSNILAAKQPCSLHTHCPLSHRVRAFPRGPVVKALYCQCGGMGLILGWGTKSSQAAKDVLKKAAGSSPKLLHPGPALSTSEQGSIHSRGWQSPPPLHLQSLGQD